MKDQVTHTHGDTTEKGGKRMEDQQPLGFLLQGKEVWKQWRQMQPGVRPQLTGTHLSNADLRGVDLSQADLSNADLSEAILRGANLHKARLC